MADDPLLAGVVDGIIRLPPGTADLDDASQEALDHASLEALDGQLNRLWELPRAAPAVACVLAAKATQVSATSPQARAVISEYQRLVWCSGNTYLDGLTRRFVALTRRVVSLAHERNESARIVNTVRAALRAYPQSETHFSPLHADLLAACVSAQMYHVAAAMKMPVAVDAATGIQAVDIQLIYYYWSLVCIARGDFRGALQSYQLLFAVPAHTVTDVAADAYKKYLVVAMCVSEGIPVQPKHVNNAVNIKLSQIGAAYVTLAQVISTSTVDEVNKYVASQTQLFHADCNMGLIKQALSMVRRRRVQRLTETYLTLSLNDVATKTNLSSEDEAEHVLLEMHLAGEISATIDGRARVATFQERSEIGGPSVSGMSTESHSSQASTPAGLATEMERCVKCVEDVLAFRKRIMQDPNVVKFETVLEDLRAKDRALNKKLLDSIGPSST